jgi:hypothetical protein
VYFALSSFQKKSKKKFTLLSSDRIWNNMMKPIPLIKKITMRSKLNQALKNLQNVYNVTRKWMS